MKKFLFLMLFAFTSIFASAVPDGCYNGRYDCEVFIQGEWIHGIDRNGNVKWRWHIEREDSDGTMYLKSEYGATQTAKWGRENGEIWLYFNYSYFVHE